VHRVDQPRERPEPIKKLFGDGPAYVAVRPDAIMVAFGGDALGALEDGLKGKPAPAPVILLEGSAKRALPVLARIDEANTRKYQEILAKDIDRIRLYYVNVEGGPALKLRYGTNIHALMMFTTTARGTYIT